jgi:hypothetical protein
VAGVGRPGQPLLDSLPRDGLVELHDSPSTNLVDGDSLARSA